MTLDEELVQKVPLFSDLTDQEIKLVAASGSRRKYPAKNVIFQEGDLGEHLLIILLGKVKILLSGKDGQEFILAILGRGEFFGEMAILESAPRSASVITVEPCEFFLLGRNDLKALLKKYPTIGMKLLENLSQRLRKTTEQVRSLVMLDMYGRVGRCLLNLAEKQGDEINGRFLVSNRPSFQELAKMVGCSRETFSRTIKTFKENGCLTVTRHTIYINRVWE
jgi:CRP-like cAMP-binding protein